MWEITHTETLCALYAVSSYNTVAQCHTQNIHAETGLKTLPEASFRMHPSGSPLGTTSSFHPHPLNPWRLLICSLFTLLSYTPQRGRARVDWMSPIKGYLDRLRLSAPTSTTTSTCGLCVNKSRGFSAVYAQKGHPSLARVARGCLRKGRNHFPERLPQPPGL